MNNLAWFCEGGGEALIADKIKIPCVNLGQRKRQENKTRTPVRLKKKLDESYPDLSRLEAKKRP